MGPWGGWGKVALVGRIDRMGVSSEEKFDVGKPNGGMKMKMKMKI